MLYATPIDPQDPHRPAPARMYDVPMPDLQTYEQARLTNPCGILPMPGEPVLGHVAGVLHVRASNGVEVGYYDYWADVFYADGDADMPLGLQP